MGLEYNTEQITLDRLVLYLDAANPQSFGPGSTTWNTLVLGGNGTLTNGPTYSNAGSGSVQFDGTNDYVTGSSPVGVQSVSVCAFVEVPASSRGYFFKNGKGWTHGWGFGMGGSTGANDSFDATGNKIVAVYGQKSWINTTATLDAGWQMVSMVVGSTYATTIYKNAQGFTSVILNAGQTPASVPSNASIYYVADSPEDTLLAGTPERALDCKIGTVMVYSKELSAADIERNFNALRNRYGI